jgi:hypothetical protein
VRRDWEERALSTAERERLALLADRLERERPLPSPHFRGEMRRSLMEGPRRGSLRAPSLRVRVASYVGAGSLCLLVAAAGLVGAGPFAA